MTLACAEDGAALIAQGYLLAASAGVVPAHASATPGPHGDETWHSANLDARRLHERAEGIKLFRRPPAAVEAFGCKP